MPESTRELSIKPSELGVVRDAIADCEELRSLLASLAPASNGRIVMPLTSAQVELMSDALDARLITVGFDEDYEITAAGRVLESLMDQLGPLPD